MPDHQRRIPIGTRLYASVLAVFLLFAIGFLVFQQDREKDYKVQLLDIRLQDFNARINQSIVKGDRTATTARTDTAGKAVTDSTLMQLIQWEGIPNLRVTLIKPDGKVIFDNFRKDYANFANHSNRPEIRQALKTGHGTTVDRSSSTTEGDYFYSANYFKDSHLIIRSALPYNNDLAKTLATDHRFLWFTLIAIIILTVVLYRFTHRLGQNISKLRSFAKRADHNENLDTEDLAVFPPDELGEIAERIIKLYMRLEHTRKEQGILKRQLTQNIAHELKTPVASIQGYLETIINNPDMSADMKRAFLDRCYAQSQRLTSLLRDISTLNRMDDAPDLMGKTEVVDISEVVQSIIKDTTLQMQERKMKFVSKLPERVLVHGNRSLLYSIFRNLTDNAIAYAGEGTTITLEARLGDEESVSGVPPHWHFVFSDNGVGVPVEHLSRIFERFYRIDKGRSRKMGGTGLGLAIVKNAVLLHGGTITARNNPTGGLRFMFSLSE